MSRPRDIDAFLSSYSGQRPDPSSSSNVLFYSNRLPLQPDGLKYDEFMRRYERDWVELEMNHGYVQWLFPIRERGVNPLAQPLQVHEIESMQSDPAILDRLLRSYKMMLAFYGIDFNDGKLRLSSEYKERLRNLQSRSHNLLRLTRIMKHLSEFDALQPHVGPLVLFFAAAHGEGVIPFDEGSMRGDSMDRWWSNVFRDEVERKEIRGIVRSRGGFGEKNWGWTEFERWYDAVGNQGYTGES